MQPEPQRKLAEIRQEHTPEGSSGNDTFIESAIQPESDREEEEQELWGEVQDNPNVVINKQVLEENKEAEKEKEKSDDWMSDGDVKEEEEDIQNKRRGNVSYIEKQQQHRLKTYKHEIDPKFMKAIKLLFFTDIKGLIEKKDGFIRLSANKTVDLCYYSEEVFEKVVQKLEDFIDDINIVELEKRDFESGFLLSRHWKEKLKNQGIGIITKQRTHNEKTEYFLCGKISQQTLHKKILEIRKFNFMWLYIPKFKNTRSYNMIFKRIFLKEEFRGEVRKKFNMENIEIALPKDEKENENQKYRKHKISSLEVVMTVKGKKTAVFEEVGQFISNIIRENYYILVFYIERKKEENIKKYVPKIEETKGIEMFYVHERFNPVSYLCLIIDRKKYKENVELIAKEIDELKLNIRGKRHFQGFLPQFSNTQLKEKYWNILKFPHSHPYSTTIVSNKVQFDWKAWLKGIQN